MTKRSRCFFLLVACLSVRGFGQTAIELRAKEAVTISNQSAGMFQGQFRCDADSNVYLVPAPYEPVFPNTVVRVSSDGKHTTQFSLSNVPELGKAGITDFAIGPRNEVQLLVLDAVGPILVRFDSDGRYKSRARLEIEGLLATQVAVFESGESLVSGHLSNGRKPFAGIFNSRGQLLATVKLQNDAETVNLSDPKSDAAKWDAFVQSIDASIAEPGGDGNLYLTRSSITGPVFVISPSGEVVSTFNLIPPSRQEVVLISSVKVSGGRLAVTSEGKRPKGGTAPTWISVYNSKTGEKVAEYFSHDPAIGGGVVCYSQPDQFTFLTVSKGKLQLVRAGGASLGEPVIE